MDTVIRVQILDEADCISHSTNTIGKGMKIATSWQKKAMFSICKEYLQECMTLQAKCTQIKSNYMCDKSLSCVFIEIAPIYPHITSQNFCRSIYSITELIQVFCRLLQKDFSKVSLLEFAVMRLTILAWDKQTLL